MVFGFVKNLLGFKFGGVVTDGQLNPSNIGLKPVSSSPEMFSRGYRTRFKNLPSTPFKLGGVIRLKKRKKKCGCKK